MKKILSLVLAILMSLSVASMIGAAEEAAIVAEDTVVAAATEEEVATQFDEAIKFLQEYGIFKGKGDGKLGAADAIKRYEMALFVSRISTGWVDDEQWKVWWVGTDATVAEEWYDREHDVTGFTDLEGTPATNYLGALSYASQKGIILGYGDGKFGPEDGIRYEDALTMLCRVLEYNNLEWPWGYIEKAVNLGLTKGIPTSVAYRDRLNRGQVAQLIYNALFAQMKNGGTLASRYFNGALEWKTIVITGAGYGRLLPNDLLDNGSLYDLGGVIAFRTVTELGEVGTETYFVKNIEELGWLTKHYERYVGYAYKALFTKDEKSNYVTLVHVKNLYNDTVSNRGRLAKTADDKYPIAAFLEGKKLVSKFTADGSYLNTILAPNSAYTFGEFILRNALQTPVASTNESSKFAIDFNTYNIVEYKLTEDGKLVDKETIEDIWYWNSELRCYFKVLFDKDDNIYGVKLLDEKDVADLLAKTNKWTYKGGLDINTDPAKGTAYADLAYFTILDWDKPNYGLFEAYRLGQYKTCTDAKDAEGKEKAGFYVNSLNSLAKYFWDYGYPDKDAYVNYSVGKTPTEGKGQLGWISEDGLTPADGDYIIYNFDEATKELKVVKIINDTTADENNYVGAGVLRGWKLADKKFNIDGKDYYFDYNELLGNGLYIHDGDSRAEKNAFTNFFRGLFNQYVKFLVVDGRVVYMWKSGYTNDVIVVDSYAGLSSDGYIVVNGYNTADLKYTQFKIGSYNGWVKGDYFYYPDNATVDAAFARGTVYKLTSIDKSGKDPIYYVYTIAQANYRYNDLRSITWSEYDFTNLESAYVDDGTYPIYDWEVTLEGGYKQFAIAGEAGDWSKAKASDKYIFILNGVGHNYAPIIVYQGTGTSELWQAGGTLINGKGADDPHVVVDAWIECGFNMDEWDISYVLFLKYNYNFGAYDSTYAGDWYLLGASNFTATVLNLYTGKEEDVIAVNKDLKKGYAYPCINGQIVEDGKGNNKDVEDSLAPFNVPELNHVITCAYPTYRKYVFGGWDDEAEEFDHFVEGDGAYLFDAEKFSKKVLSPDYYALKKIGKTVVDKGGAKDLTTGTTVILVKTDGIKVTDWTTLDKVGLKKIAAKYDDNSIPYWYINTIGGGTVIYIFETGNVTETEELPLAATNALLAETAKEEYDLDTALIKASGIAEATTKNDVIQSATLKSLTFTWADNPKDEHGFTVTGEDHNAIYLDSFEFGDDAQCTKNDWNTAVTKDGDSENYMRDVGTLAAGTYAPHGTDGTKCDLIKTVTVDIPTKDGFNKIAFPTMTITENEDGSTTTVYDGNLVDGKYVKETSFNVNFKDIDRDGNEEVYNFDVIITVAATFNDDGTYKSVSITMSYNTDAAAHLGGDCTIAEVVKLD